MGVITINLFHYSIIIVAVNGIYNGNMRVFHITLETTHCYSLIKCKEKIKEGMYTFFAVCVSICEFFMS